LRELLYRFKGVRSAAQAGRGVCGNAARGRRLTGRGASTVRVQLRLLGTLAGWAPALPLLGPGRATAVAGVLWTPRSPPSRIYLPPGRCRALIRSRVSEHPRPGWRLAHQEPIACAQLRMNWQTWELGQRLGKQVRGMTYYEAAIEVLKAANRPLTTQEVTDQALKRGLITTSGKTPEATMSAVLYVRLRNDPNLVKLEDPGGNRARRGSVRWALHHA
jgi:hypothetical protein